MVIHIDQYFDFVLFLFETLMLCAQKKDARNTLKLTCKLPYKTECVISIFRQINSFCKIKQIYKTFSLVPSCRDDSVTKLMIDRILSFLLTHVFNYIPPILQPTQNCDKWFIFHLSFILHHIILLGANEAVIFKFPWIIIMFLRKI